MATKHFYLNTSFLILQFLITVSGLTVTPPTKHDQETFSQALSVIANLEHAPSCNRLAATVLVDSCKTLEPGHDVNIALDHVKSTFAARLAVCELLGAHAVVPQQCLQMVPQPQDRSRTSLKCLLPGSKCSSQAQNDALSTAAQFQEINQAQISDCLLALESRSQWWTSYSNARQNAISICHAARAEIDREAVLNVHQSMAGVSSDLSDALQQRLKDSNDQATQQHTFAAAIRELQDKLMKDMELSQKAAGNRFGTFVSDAEKRLSSLFTATFRNLNSANDQVQTMSNIAAQSNQEVGQARQKLSAMLKDATSGASAITQAQNKALATQNDLSTSLQSLHNNDIKAVIATFESLQTELQASAQLMALMHNRQTEHDLWLQGLDAALNQLAHTTLALKDLQEAQAANQTALLDTVNAKIENLGSAIDAKTHAVRALTLFGDFGPVARLAAAVGLVVAAGVVDRRLAVGVALYFGLGYAVTGAAAGRAWLSDKSGSARWREAVTGSMQQQWSEAARHYFPILLPVLAMLCLGIGVTAMWATKWVARRRERAQFEALSLPDWGKI